MQNIIITIAVACYNNEKYLRDCLDSVICQQGDDLEILIVDDASTDSSFDICRQYAQKDSRIRLFRHEENLTPSGTRNTAIEHARGKWITFVDGDDLLTGDAISIMRKYTGSTAELVVFHYSRLAEGTVVEGTPEFQAEVLSANEDLALYKCRILNGFNERFHNLNCWTPWCKLLRMSFLQKYDLKFDLSVPRGQDAVLHFLCAHYFSSVELVPENTYIYRLNEGSIGARFQKEIHIKETRLVQGHRRNIDYFDEASDERLMRSYYRLCLYSFKEALSLGAYHKDCPWSKAERLAWLEELCGFDWVREMCDHYSDIPCEKEKDRKLVKLIQKQKYHQIDRKYHSKAVLKRIAFVRALNDLRKKIMR